MAIQIRKKDLGTNKYPQIADGGESQIFEYDTNRLAKIYKESVLIDQKGKKVKAWLKTEKIPFVISPLEEINIENRFAGFLMERIENGMPIGSLAKKKYLRLTGYTDKEILEFLIKYSRMLEKLHRSGKYIGDINEENVLIKEKDLYYIDADSFGIDSLPADAYTDLYTDPNAYVYEGNVLKRVEMSEKTDMYAFAVLAFKLLTRMHPFNGTYEKDPDMNPMVRMEKKISVLGGHPVGIPPMITSWNFLSPQLLDVFYRIFEKGERCYITKELEDMYQHLKYCDTHALYYYSKYTECPLCNKEAKISEMPTVTKAQNMGSLKISILNKIERGSYFFGFTQYLRKDGKFVHLATGNTWKSSRSNRVEFTENGAFALEIYDSSILVYEVMSKELLFTIPKAYRSSVSIVGQNVYYIDETMKFSRSEIRKAGNFYEAIFPAYLNTIFTANRFDYCAILLYAGKMLINTKKYNVFVNYSGKIQEYAIQYDEVSQNWLFIYEMSNGLHRTIVISKKGEVIFDSTMYRYTASSLMNICFANNTIFAPSDGKIVGINYVENRVKNFDCYVVNEESLLRFTKGGFDIVNENVIYRFGA